MSVPEVTSRLPTVQRRLRHVDSLCFRQLQSIQCANGSPNTTSSPGPADWFFTLHDIAGLSRTSQGVDQTGVSRASCPAPTAFYRSEIQYCTVNPSFRTLDKRLVAERGSRHSFTVVLWRRPHTGHDATTIDTPDQETAIKHEHYEQATLPSAQRSREGFSPVMRINLDLRGLVFYGRKMPENDRSSFTQPCVLVQMRHWYVALLDDEAATVDAQSITTHDTSMSGLDAISYTASEDTMSTTGSISTTDTIAIVDSKSIRTDTVDQAESNVPMYVRVRRGAVKHMYTPKLLEKLSGTVRGIDKLQASTRSDMEAAQQVLASDNYALQQHRLRSATARVARLNRLVQARTRILQQREDTLSRTVDKSLQQEKRVEALRQQSEHTQPRLDEIRQDLARQQAELEQLLADLRQRKITLILELHSIYKTSQVSAQECRILDIELPADANTIARVASDRQDENMAAGLGYVAHFLVLASKYLQIPLRFPIKPFGSRSRIKDPQTNREYPLYRFRRDLEHALSLLLKDVEQLLNFIGRSMVEETNLLLSLRTFVLDLHSQAKQISSQDGIAPSQDQHLWSASVIADDPVKQLQSRTRDRRGTRSSSSRTASVLSSTPPRPSMRAAADATRGARTATDRKGSGTLSPSRRVTHAASDLIRASPMARTAPASAVYSSSDT